MNEHQTYIIAEDFGTIRTMGLYGRAEIRTLKAERMRLDHRLTRKYGVRAPAPDGWRWLTDDEVEADDLVCGIVKL